MAAINVLTFASFSLTDPDMFTTLDKVHLMVGFISLSYLSATIVSINWVITSLGQVLSTILVFRFFLSSEMLSSEFVAKPYPAFLMLIASTALVTYDNENKERDLNHYHSAMENQIKSLKVVFDSIPEGVVISSKETNEVILTNKEAKRLFKNSRP